MDAVRKIIEHSTNPLTIDSPEEYNNRKVEVNCVASGRRSGKKDISNFFENWNGKATHLQNKKNLEMSGNRLV